MQLPYIELTKNFRVSISFMLCDLYITHDCLTINSQIIAHRLGVDCKVVISWLTSLISKVARFEMFF